MGVTIEVGAKQTTLRFTSSAKAIYDQYRNRGIWLQCVLIEEKPDGSFGDTTAVSIRVKVRRVIRVRLQRPPGGFSYCRLSRSAAFYDSRRELVAIPLGRVGRLYLNERDTALLVFGLMGGAYAADGDGWRYVSPAEFAARFSGSYTIEQLSSPDASPSPGAIGYWSDVHKHALVAKLTSRGTRFFLEMDNGVMSTNTVAYLRYVYG
jgi:hypothetical protein